MCENGCAKGLSIFSAQIFIVLLAMRDSAAQAGDQNSTYEGIVKSIKSNYNSIQCISYSSVVKSHSKNIPGLLSELEKSPLKGTVVPTPAGTAGTTTESKLEGTIKLGKYLYAHKGNKDSRTIFIEDDKIHLYDRQKKVGSVLLSSKTRMQPGLFPENPKDFGAFFHHSSFMSILDNAKLMDLATISDASGGKLIRVKLKDKEQFEYQIEFSPDQQMLPVHMVVTKATCTSSDDTWEYQRLPESGSFFPKRYTRKFPDCKDPEKSPNSWIDISVEVTGDDCAEIPESVFKDAIPADAKMSDLSSLELGGKSELGDNTSSFQRNNTTKIALVLVPALAVVAAMLIRKVGRTRTLA